VGVQPVREAIRAHGARLGRVLLAARETARLEALGRFARDQGIAVERVPASRLDALARGGSHQGAAAFAPELRLLSPEALCAPAPDGSPAVVLALDGITDPQNFGAAIRSAVALGSGAVLWGEHRSAPLSLATFRASAGAVEHARLSCVASLHDAVAALGARGLTTVALDAAGAATLDALDLRGPVVLAVGAEDRGLSRALRRACAVHARLRMTGPIGSLNASAAAAAALYEVARQRCRHQAS
jgi:23S rRNA (guanosine2251-2'-O)-methyltransferase